jgi:hypothetical protein
MKYIISEIRLDNVIFKYLDSKLDGIELKKAHYSDIVFAFPGEESGLMRWMGKKSIGQLLTYYEIVDEVETMFSMDQSDALDLIGRYVESRYNLKVNKNSKVGARYQFFNVGYRRI